MGQLDGRVVLVTGGNGGIGFGIAAACAAAGARVVIWGRDEAKNDASIKQLRAEGATADAFVCDVSDPDQITATMAASVDVAGKVDSVFANAGTTGIGKSFLDVDLTEWRRVMATNLDAVFLTLQAAARHMVERGEGGALIPVSSTSAIHGAAGNDAYGAAKTALLGLTRSMAVGLARYKIRVNALIPGWTITDLARGGYENDKFRDATVRRTPVRRWAEPSEMGPVGVYLADPTITYHTGDHVTVDGGYTVF
jgi:NAD(P)-dependent dehydrogenase (short-subunit alcohol dehydrogenase family)